jgi:DNA-binding MarR family transcriptional regulator/GNAT superfamily N-acetyltransferase
MVETDADPRVAVVRRFNRFYTRRIGVLEEGVLKSPWSLTEGRVLYELAHQDKPTAAEVGKELGLDAGYLSRILRGFEKRGLIDREPSEADGRQSLLSLTPQGWEVFGDLDARANADVGALLRKLSEPEGNQLIEAMKTIERLLGGRSEARAPYLLRPHRPGDMGWVVHRHGVLYAQEYGWDEQMEALIAEIVAKFIREFDPKRERCWIAEKDGVNVGSVFLVKHTDEVAQLRLLLVEPAARGLGIGSRLVEECLRFARSVGYSSMMLWTNSVLHAARRIYQAAGFRLVHEEPHHSFGQDLVGQTWELTL